MILFLDDERELNYVASFQFREKAMLPNFTEEQRKLLTADRRNDKIVTVRSVKAAKEYIEENGIPDMIFFDNDLGEHQPEGYDFLKWLLNRNPSKFEAYFHTWNTVARKNMQMLYDNYAKEFWDVN